MGDLLGRSRNLGQGSGMKPYSYTYGRPSGLTSKSPAEWSVAETMRVGIAIVLIFNSLSSYSFDVTNELSAYGTVVKNI